MNNTQRSTGKALITALDDVVGRRNAIRSQAVGYAVAAALEGGCFALLVPILRAIFDASLDTARPWIVALCICAVASGAITYALGNRAYRIGIDTLAGGAMHRIGTHAVTLPLGWFDRKHTAWLASLVTESSTTLMTIPGLIVSRLVGAVVTPLTATIVVLAVDWRMGLVMLVFVPLGVYAYRRLSQAALTEYSAMGISDEEVSARVIEFGQAQTVLRAAGHRDHSWDRLDETLRANRDSVVHLLNTTDRPLVRFKAVVQAGFAAIVVGAALFGVTGLSEPTDLLVALFLGVRFIEPLIGAGGLGAEGIAHGLTGVRRIQRFCATPGMPEPSRPVMPSTTEVTTDTLTFGYGATPVLSDIGIRLDPGTMTAIVGPSGSGKSTLTRLITRFWDPDSGAVLLGGTDLREIGSADVMKSVATVSQNVYLFDGTILDNIRIGRPDADDHEVLEAARSAQLHHTFERLPDDWHTRVGEGGSLLSGGERQRVSIARALLKDAPIVILDEVTSALDAENELAVTDAIHAVTRGRTVLVVAHRLSTIRRADRIVYLDDGRVVEYGTPEELLATGGRFAALVADREAADNWQIDRSADRGTPHPQDRNQHR